LFRGVTNTRKARTRKSPAAAALNLFLMILVLVLGAAQEAAYQNPSLETTRRENDREFPVREHTNHRDHDHHLG
jgi:hypothetical protein